MNKTNKKRTPVEIVKVNLYTLGVWQLAIGFLGIKFFNEGLANASILKGMIILGVTGLIIGYLFSQKRKWAVWVTWGYAICAVSMYIFNLKILGVLLFIRLMYLIYQTRDIQPFYNDIEARKVTWNNLSNKFKKRVSKGDVALVLDLEFKYQQKIGIVNKFRIVKGRGTKTLSSNVASIIIDGGKLNKFIIAEAEKKGRTYVNEELDAILAAEEVYLDQIGVLEEVTNKDKIKIGI